MCRGNLQRRLPFLRPTRAQAEHRDLIASPYQLKKRRGKEHGLVVRMGDHKQPHCIMRSKSRFISAEGSGTGFKVERRGKTISSQVMHSFDHPSVFAHSGCLNFHTTRPCDAHLLRKQLSLFGRSSRCALARRERKL